MNAKAKAVGIPPGLEQLEGLWKSGLLSLALAASCEALP